MEQLIINALIVYGIETVHKGEHRFKPAMAWSLVVLLAQEVYWTFTYLDSTWQRDVYDVIFSVGYVVGQTLAIAILAEIIHRIVWRL